MANLNRVQIIGNVGRSPELRFTPDGTPVCGFSVAVNSYQKQEGGAMNENTEWFTVIAWRKLAETCNQFVTKGMSVYVEGRLKTHFWEDTEGNKRNKTEIIAYKILFLSRGDVTVETAEPPGTEEFDPEDIPF